MGLAAARQLLQLLPQQGGCQITQGQGLPASPSQLQQVGLQMVLDLVLPVSPVLLRPAGYPIILGQVQAASASQLQELTLTLTQ